MSIAVPTQAPAAASNQATPELAAIAAREPGRWMAILLLLIMSLLLAAALSIYFRPAHGGTDQNGYLSTARMMLEQHTLHFVPKNPYHFAGHMMIETEDGRIFAKYPPGYALLGALGRTLGGLTGMYAVNWICAVLACYFAYFLFRTQMGSMASLCGAILLACNPLTLFWSNEANSHTPTLLCVVLGFWGVLRWYQTGSLWRGFVGGFALGYACTIRYTEFLLVLPVLFAALTHWRCDRARARMCLWASLLWMVPVGTAAALSAADVISPIPFSGRVIAGIVLLPPVLLWIVGAKWDFRRVLQSLPVVIGWAIPIGMLALVCWISFGRPWKTGYTYCAEDTGFALKYFLGDATTNPPIQGNWETLIQQMNRTGLFLVWPLGLAGLLGLLAHHWRVATTLLLWIVPGMTLYLFYYWAPTGEETVSYLRFFMSLFPGLILAGVWLVDHVASRGKTPRWLGLGLITLIAAITSAALYAYWTPDTPDDPAAPGWCWFFTLLPLAVLLGVWWREREQAERAVVPALTLGALTALGSAINLYTIQPQVERATVNQQSLANISAMVREKAPSGSVIFSDEQTCNLLDCIGGYQLYSAGMFQMNYVDRMWRIGYPEQAPRAGREERDEDPNPIQRTRARGYVAALGPQYPTLMKEFAPKPDKPRPMSLAILGRKWNSPAMVRPAEEARLLDEELRKVDREVDRLEADRKRSAEEKAKLGLDPIRIEWELAAAKLKRQSLEPARLDNTRERFAVAKAELESERQKLQEEKAQIEEEQLKPGADRKKLDAERQAKVSELERKDAELRRLRTEQVALEWYALDRSIATRQTDLIASELAAGHRVFFVLPKTQLNLVPDRADWERKTVQQWKENRLLPRTTPARAGWRPNRPRPNAPANLAEQVDLVIVELSRKPMPASSTQPASTRPAK